MKNKCISLVLISCLFVLGCSQQEDAQELLISAQASIEAGDHKTAEIQLKNVIQQEPENAKARFMLGELYLNRGFASGAEKELERAYRLSYQAEKTIPLLARAYALTEAQQDLLALADKANTLSAQAHTRVLAYKTLILVQQAKLDEAKSTIEAAKSLGDGQSWVLLSEAYVALAEEQFEQAMAMVNKALAAMPEQPDAIFLKSKIALANGDNKLAIENFELFLRLQPDYAITHVLLADAYLKDEQYDNAEKQADIILSFAETQAFANYIKAATVFRRQAYGESLRYAETALQSGMKTPQLWLIAGASAFYEKNFQRCYDYLENVVNYLPADHAGRKMFAYSQVQLGSTENLEQILNPDGTVIDGNSEFVSLITYDILELGDLDKARKIAANINVSATDAGSQTRAGVLKLMINDPTGIQNLENAIAINPEMKEAQLALAYASINTGNFEQAIAIARQWQTESPDAHDGYTLEGMTLKAQQDYAQAEQLLKTAIAKDAETALPKVELTGVLRAQGKIEEATANVDALYRDYPNNAKVLRQYYMTYRNDIGVKAVKQALDKNRTDVALTVLYAEALIDQREYEKAILALNEKERNVHTSKRIWQLLIISYAQLDDRSMVESTLLDWIRKNPYQVEPVLLLSNHYTAQEQIEDAISALKKGLDQNEDNIVLQLALLRTYLLSDNAYQANKVYRSIKPDKLTPSLMAEIEGKIAYREGKLALAASKFEQAYQHNQSSNNARLVAVSYDRLQQQNKSIAFFEKHLAEHATDSDVRILLANYYLSSNRDKAINEYEKVVDLGEKNPVVLNNLAFLYLEKNDANKALPLAQSAYELAPSIPDVVDTYALCLYKSGNIAEAQTKSAQAYKLAKGKSADIALNYAEILVAAQQGAQAQQVLDSLPQLNSEQSKRADSLRSRI
ncbi:XrtA/PEP-CTERM system TPR-repeat protein PrsT [Thalassotalea agarivorans]|uniref:Putative PEP-CTERM system TPR-repeat lipoprotein n=1 Tax=Thalassotalea agarivorans TaxID=349064 RepID=A0A1I0DWR0_THASX|nr:XrtA/PEP-CTERM system TPR-repeat protein PrsT [Thalassotalea agarivorans]SET36462.1 putative PEP-CTERM system TPR-repeat lipoprotein [Thalassotalea agarivorans]